MPKNSEHTYGVVFGVFDGLHKGHEYFLREATKRCHQLIVVLTLPETAMLLKGYAPKNTFEARAKAILSIDPRIRVVKSDKDSGKWSIFRDMGFDLASHIAILGYDQTAIASELDKIKIPHITLPSFHREIYKSSLLR